MARKRRKSRKKSPIVFQLQAPKPRRNPRKKKRARRRRRRNTAATVVNPSPVTYVTLPRKKKRRRRRRNPTGLAAVPKSLKDLTKVKVVAPIVAGGGIGVALVAAVDKWVAPHVSPIVLTVIKIVAGVALMPILNRFIKGAGMYSLGFVAGEALTPWVSRWLPFGGAPSTIGDVYDQEAAAVSEGLGYPEFSGDDADELGDAAAGGDEGVEEVIRDPQDGVAKVVDGLGILPPFPIPPMPMPLVGMLRKRGLLWLTRMGLEEGDLSQLMRLPPGQRRPAIARLRAAYIAKKRGHARAHGPRFARRPIMAHHPMRRRRPRPGRPGRPPRPRPRPQARPVRPPRGRRGGRRHGKFRGFDEDIATFA